MAASGSGQRRALKAGLFGLWILEWILGWSSWLGPLEGIIEVVWFLGLAYFVLESRSGRLPRALHTWGWMGAVLGIVVLRALWVGDEGLLFFSELAREAGEAGWEPVLARGEWIAVDSLATSMILGLAIGALGLMEAAIIAAMSRVGDLFRERAEAPRVGLLPRLAVTLLQAPIFLGLMGVGLTAVAGAFGADAHPGRDAGRPEVDTAGLLWIVRGVGLGAWVLAVVHLRRLEALAAGGAVTRLLLGLFALAAAAAWIVAAGLDLGSLALALLWLGLQIAAIRWARPAAPAAASR